MKFLGLLLTTIMAVAGVHAADTIAISSLENEVPEAVSSLMQIDELVHAAQEQFWQLLPPAGDDLLYIHPDRTVRAVDWNSKEWPRVLKRQMYAEMETVNFSMYPFYRLTVIETRSGELVYYNSYDQEVWRTPAPLGYTPYSFALEQYRVESETELTAQQKLLGRSSNVGIEIRLLPESFVNSYEQDVAAEELTLQEPIALMAPVGMMMAPMAMGSGVELQMDIDRLTNGTVEVFVEWLSSLDSDSLDLFLCSDLIAADWQLQTNFPTASSTNFSFSDQDTNLTVRFYVTGTMHDEDFDGLTSARERYLYKTREDLFSTDADGLGDGWEILYGSDPFSTSGTNGALGDADNDGLSNLEEQLNGSDPTDPQSNPNTGTVATIRYYFDEDDHLTDFYSGAEVAQKTILTATHNIAEEVSAK